MSSLLPFRENEPEESSYQAYFVDVILPLAVAQSYTYRVPSELKDAIQPGQRMVVQFGKKKIYTALALEVHQRAPKDYPAKYILEIIDTRPIVSALQLEFWQWIAAYYCCTLGEVMDAALPANMKMESETKVTLNHEPAIFSYELSEKEKVVITALHHKQVLTINEIAELLDQKTVVPLIKSLYDKGMVNIREEVEDGYRPKREIFVTHEIDIQDKELLRDIFNMLEKAPRQSDLLLAYTQSQNTGKPVLRRQLLKQAGASAAALDALIEKGILKQFEDEVDRIQAAASTGWKYELNEEQRDALSAIRDEMERKGVVLLHGVTGSGKTHIYMEMMAEVIEEGRQALYLVPEIALTAQLIQRLRAKYGNDIGIYHSKFTADERVEIWNKVLDKTYKIVLGVRSALFLPFEELGLVIIDEEHEHSFKQYEPNPRYHARDAAIFLASLHGAKTIMGTATPSFESYFNATRKKYGFVKMLKRYSEIQLPEMIIADLREEHRKKLMKSHFSSVLYQEMHKTLKSGGQVILFQNRRGYAPLLECTTCGWVPMCQNCDISLTYHQSARQMVCHYCGYKDEVPKKCKACGNYSMKMLGFGTEKIEDELKIFFPDHTSMRMDQDTTRGKQSYTKIINAVEDGDVQILVGTQMVTKGLDFENVRLVGILNADQMLRYPDFRAIERSYQLMSQVAGRAGRRGIQGKVIIQTYNMQHPVFHFLLQHDYEGFYNHDIGERIDYKYPPFFKLIKIIMRHEKVELVKQASQWMAERLRDVFGARVLGPEAPPIARIRNKYIMHILLKYERQNMNMSEAKAVLMREVEHFRRQKEFSGVRLAVDVDPY